MKPKRRAVLVGWLLCASYLPAATVNGPTSSTVGNLMSWGDATGTTALDSGVPLMSLAPTASPTFTGVMTVPTGTGHPNPGIQFNNNGYAGDGFYLSENPVVPVYSSLYVRLSSRDRILPGWPIPSVGDGIRLAGYGEVAGEGANGIAIGQVGAGFRGVFLSNINGHTGGGIFQNETGDFYIGTYNADFSYSWLRGKAVAYIDFFADASWFMSNANPWVDQSLDLGRQDYRWRNSFVVNSKASRYYSKEAGSGADSSGTCTLSSGTCTVSTTAVSANSRIMLTVQDPNGGTPGNVYIASRTAGTSFTVNSSNGSDTSVVAWFIVEKY